MIESVFPGGLEPDVRQEARTNKKKIWKLLLSTSDVFVGCLQPQTSPTAPLPLSVRADLRQVSRIKGRVMTATRPALHFLTGGVFGCQMSHFSASQLLFERKLKEVSFF